MRHAASISLRAAWILPIAGPPLENAVISLSSDGRIESVGENPPAGSRLIDLGSAAILPGWCNAHTHLEFSGLAAPLGRQGMPLPEWIAEVVAYRRRQEPEQVARQIRRGLAESIRCGTTLLGEIAAAEPPPQVLEQARLRGTLFLELIGLSAERVGPLLERARGHLQRRLPGTWSAGLSPHAPFSVHREVVRQASLLCRGGPVVAMHLAESPEELELLRGLEGGMSALLRKLDAWHPESLAAAARPLDYLRLLAEAERALVVHGNYLDEDEWALAADRAATMTVVYCPRTHSYFGHARYPLRRMLERGVAVAVGTDSRASNPDLSVLAELRHAARRHPDVPPADLVRLGTLNGARALGQDADCGTLAPGKRADLCIVALPDADLRAEPCERLLRGDEPVVATLTGGRVVFDPDGRLRA